MEIDAYLDMEKYKNNITVFVRGEVLTKNNQTRYVLIPQTIIIEVLIPIPRVSFSSTYRRFQTYFPARECTYIIL